MPDSIIARDTGFAQGRTDLLRRVGALLPSMRERAAAHDAAGTYPLQDMQALAASGALAAPLPAHLGGLGMGTGIAGAPAVARLLHLLGQGNMAVGRLYEGHVNALRLAWRFGSPAQLRRAAEDARAGHLFAIWVTDDAEDPLRCDGAVLAGRKAICSGAGHVTRPLVTVHRGEARPWMAVLKLDGAERVAPAGTRLSGMRAACSLPVRFDGVTMPDDPWLGGPGDYLREPDFSAGAWRNAAVAAGGLAALVEAAGGALAARGRAADPHQRARLGHAMMAAEAAWLWTRQAALLAEDDDVPVARAVAYVGLARSAVEQAGEAVIPLVQRSLGLGAFRQPDRVEQLCRDLAVYLRQPAPDEVLDRAAAHFTGMAAPLAGDAMTAPLGGDTA